MKKISWFVFICFIFLFTSCTSKDDEREKIRTEFNEKLETFSKDIHDFSLRTEVYIENKNKDIVVNSEKVSSQIVRISETPLYMELSEEGSPQTILYLEENGDVVSYEITDENGYKNVRRKYISSLEEFKLSIVEELPINFSFDGSYSNIYKKQEDTYGFSFTLNEMLESMPDSGLEEIISSLGELKKYILDTPWNAEVAIYSEILKISFSCFFPLDLDKPEYELGTRIDFFCSKMKIDRIDVTKLKVETPQSIEDIYKTTPINQYFTVEKGYYRFNLEPGKYAIDATDHDLYGLKAKLFNEEKEELPIGIGFDAQFSSIEEFVFDIEKAGTYYFYLDSYNSIRCQMRALNYNNTSSKTNPLELKNTSGVIEGKFDFRVYNYNSETEGILCIENKMDTPIFAILPQYSYDYLSQIDRMKYSNESWMGKQYIRVKPGDNYIILSTDYNAFDYSYSYEFTIEFLPLENGYEENYEDLEKLTEDYSSSTYMSGLCLSKNPRLSLEVTEKALYVLDAQCSEESMGLNFTIEAVEGNVKTTGSSNAFLLEPGRYIVNIVNNNHIFGIGKVRYQKVSIEDQDIEVEVKQGNIEDLYTNDFPFIFGQKVISEQKIRYFFTLTETSKIFYNDMIIYDIEGERLNLVGYELFYKDVIELPAGKYYFIIPNESSNYGTPIFKYYFAKIDVELDVSYNPYEPLELELDKAVSITPIDSWDKQCFKINITEDGTYTFNQNVFLFDENRNYISPSSYEDFNTKKLSVGTYYIICNESSAYQLLFSKN